MIASVTLRACNQHLEDQSWRFAGAGITKVPGLIVCITDTDGVTGFGYTRGMPPTTLPVAAIRVVLEDLISILPGRDPAAIGQIMAEMEARLNGQPFIKSAIECALFELRARSLRVPLSDLFGGARSGVQLPQSRLIPLKPPGDMADVAARLTEEGYRFLKLKVSGDPSLDLDRVRAVRERVGGAVRLMVDANQSYEPKVAIPVINRMAELGIELVEQPTPANDLRGLEQVCRATVIPIEADESAQDLPAIFRLAAGRIVDSINLRVMNLGGLRNTLRAIAVCEAAGIGIRFGASFGPQLVHAQTAHLATTLPPPHFPHELAEFRHILNDPFTGLVVEHGDLVLAAGHGSGVGLHREVDAACS